MKSYNEMAQNVLRRIDEYETAKRRRNTRLAKSAAALCCCALVLLLGLGAHHSGLMEPEIPATVDDALYPGIPGIIDDRTEPAVTETVGSAESSNVILVNPMGDAPGTGTMDIARMRDDFIPMDKTELNTYYGINIFPTTVPEGLTAQDSENYGIFRRDGGTGEIYWDQNAIEFSNEDLTRWVCVTVDKGSLPYSFLAFQDKDAQSSLISGTAVIIGQWADGCYYAEFLCQDVGFRVVSEGLTLDELVAVISSLLA